MKVDFNPPLVQLKLPEPDEWQRPAIEHDGRSLIIACPGSGKTSTLANRIVRLLQRGVSPSAILPLTFSNRAARELNAVIPSVKAFTFHSFAYHLSGRGRGVITPEEQLRLIRRLFRASEWEAMHILTQIGKAKSEMIPLSGTPAQKYQTELERMGKIDFYDMLNDFIADLKRSSFLSRLKSQFRHILVDEFQDTSTQQYEILKALAEDSVFVVGDYHQSIYRWRNATPENFDRFRSDFKPKEFPLLHSYRSGAAIVELCETIYRVGMEPNGSEANVRVERCSSHDLPLYLNEVIPTLQGITYVVGRTRDVLRRVSAKLSKSHRIRTDAEGRIERSVGKPPYVELLTAHAAKGGEADNVFVVEADPDLFPHILSHDLEEERNLFYVACSRPKTNLFVLYTESPTAFLKRWLAGEYHQY